MKHQCDRNTGIPVSTKSDRPMYCSAIASLGRSSIMADHLSLVHRSWSKCSAAGSSRQAQFEKVRMSQDDCLEVGEKLDKLCSQLLDERHYYSS